MQRGYFYALVFRAHSFIVFGLTALFLSVFRELFKKTVEYKNDNDFMSKAEGRTTIPIIVNMDVMMAKRKIGLNELSELVGITLANLSILKNGKAKAIRFPPSTHMQGLGLPAGRHSRICDDDPPWPARGEAVEVLCRARARRAMKIRAMKNKNRFL